MSDYDPILYALEVDWQQRHERVRQMLYESGRPDLVADLDAKMREIHNGIHGARSAWHSISIAQRRALSFVGHFGSRLVRCGHGSYCGGPNWTSAPLWPIRTATMRNLCSRELMAWDGGAFDPEAAAVLTERGRFVLKHGPNPEPTPER